MRGEIAVVIPCYNQGRTIAETVASVLTQTRRPAEIVVVNDGSTDLYTLQVLRTSTWPGVTIVDTPNRGLAAARNHGIRQTTAEYLVTLDADDVLEPRYLESTAAVLDDDPSIGFVTTAIRGFGEASYVWTPPPCDLIAAFTRGTAHPASIFRRRLWERVGGFDEVRPLYGIEDWDFWISALERGFQGRVLSDVLLRYRVSARSMHQRNVASGVHLRAVEALLDKHRETVARLGIELLAAKEDAFLGLWRSRQQLAYREQELQREADALDQRIRQAAEALRAAGRDAVRWGDLRRLTPVSPVWGLDRGKPVDRHYIEGFLQRHRTDIRGSVLEVKDPGYTRLFGSDVTRSEVLDVDPSNSRASIVADLARADVIPSDSFDCFVLTQTLTYIYDIRAALSHACRILKPGGVLLCTMASVGRITFEEDLDGDYWRFTEASVRRLFAEVFPLEHFELTVWGNVLACTAFLYGVASEELHPDELAHVDPYFPLIITVRAVKPGGVPARTVVEPVGVPTNGRANTAGAILLYHRVASPADDHAAVDPVNFRAQMEYLRQECHLMTLQDLATAAAGGVIPSRAVALTVDDGGIDSLEVVSPMLTELGIPITFFLDTDRLDEEHERWWDGLARILLGTDALPPSLSIRVQGSPRQFDTATPPARRRAYEALHAALLRATLDERTGIMDTLVSWSGLGAVPRPTHRALTSPEIQKLAAAGHEIGAHTVHHLSLDTQPRDVQMDEIAGSKRALEQLLGRHVSAFAYPYGHHDDACASLVRAAGFSTAVIVEPRPVVAGADPFRLPRIEIGDLDGAAFSRFLQAMIR